VAAAGRRGARHRERGPLGPGARRDETADGELAEELLVKWPDWADALEGNVDLARQALGKLLASAPV